MYSRVQNRNLEVQGRSSVLAGTPQAWSPMWSARYNARGRWKSEVTITTWRCPNTACARRRLSQVRRPA